jgi:hypothetical protein
MVAPQEPLPIAGPVSPSSAKEKARPGSPFMGLRRPSGQAVADVRAADASSKDLDDLFATSMLMAALDKP